MTEEAPDWARPIVHWEIAARDPELLRKFYGRLFNWSIKEAGIVLTIDPGIGGPEPGPGGHIRQDERTGVTLYVQVRDLGASLQRAVELGGKVVVERIQVPDGATLALIEDPESNRVMLVQQ